jgi:hypothetical protein
MAENNNAFELHEGLIGPPHYAPVSYGNLQQDTIYVVRVTYPHPSNNMIDMLLQTVHGPLWKNDLRVRPFWLATRGFKRKIDRQRVLDAGLIVPEDKENEIVSLKEFTDLVGDHANTEGVFKTLDYAKDENDALIPDEWIPVDDPPFFKVYAEHTKMEIHPGELGYVFFNPAQPQQQQEGGVRRKRSKRSRLTRRAQKRSRKAIRSHRRRRL